MTGESLKRRRCRRERPKNIFGEVILMHRLMDDV